MPCYHVGTTLFIIIKLINPAHTEVEGITQGIKNRRWDHWGASYRLPTIEVPLIGILKAQCLTDIMAGDFENLELLSGIWSPK